MARLELHLAILLLLAFAPARALGFRHFPPAWHASPPQHAGAGAVMAPIAAVPAFSMTSTAPLTPPVAAAPSSSPPPSSQPSSHTSWSLFLITLGGLALLIAVGASALSIVHLLHSRSLGPLHLRSIPILFHRSVHDSVIGYRIRRRLIKKMRLELPYSEDYDRVVVVRRILKSLKKLNIRMYEKMILPDVFLSFIRKGRPFVIFTDVLNILRIVERADGPYCLVLEDTLKDIDRLSSVHLSGIDSGTARTTGRFFGKLYALRTLPKESLKHLRLSKQTLKRQPNYIYFLNGFFEELTTCIYPQPSLQENLEQFFEGNSLDDFLLWQGFMQSLTTCPRVRAALVEVLDKACKKCESTMGSNDCKDGDREAST